MPSRATIRPSRGGVYSSRTVLRRCRAGARAAAVFARDNSVIVPMHAQTYDFPRAMRFQTTLLQSGKTAVGIQVPTEVVDALGAGKRPPVRVTINGYTYRNTIAVMGGVFMVGVSAENRELAHVAGGDEVDVDIELDTQPRELTLPPDFSAALDGQPDARRLFDTLSYSRQQARVLPIIQAKTPETRKRRVDKALLALQESRAQ